MKPRSQKLHSRTEDRLKYSQRFLKDFNAGKMEGQTYYQLMTMYDELVTLPQQDSKLNYNIHVFNIKQSVQKDQSRFYSEVTDWLQCLQGLSDCFGIPFSRCITLSLHDFCLPLQHMCTDVTARISWVSELKQSIMIQSWTPLCWSVSLTSLRPQQHTLQYYPRRLFTSSINLLFQREPWVNYHLSYTNHVWFMRTTMPLVFSIQRTQQRDDVTSWEAHLLTYIRDIPPHLTLVHGILQIFLTILPSAYASACQKDWHAQTLDTCKSPQQEN